GQVPVDFANEIIFKGITVYGVIGRKMYETWNQMRRYLSAGLVDPRPVITHQVPLAEIDEALAAIRAGDAGKIILEIARALPPGSGPNSSSSSRTGPTSARTASRRRKPRGARSKCAPRSSSCHTTTTPARDP